MIIDEIVMPTKLVSTCAMFGGLWLENPVSKGFPGIKKMSKKVTNSVTRDAIKK